MNNKVRERVFGIIFILVIVLCVCAAALAADPTGSYSLDQKIDPPIQATYSYDGSNIIVIKQASSDFIWVDGTVTDDDDAIIAAAKALDSSVKTDSCYVTRLTSFKLSDFVDDPQYNFQVEINTTAKTVTINKLGDSTARVSHIDLISYDPPVETEYGSLKVTKDVLTEGASTTEKFAITVAFSGDNLSGIQCSGGTWNDETDTYDLSLADGESATFTNIPMETEYTITETLTSDQEDAGWEGPADDLEGEINDDTTDVEETVENTYDPGTPPGDPEYGSLKVTKDVLTANAPAANFAITVQFNIIGENKNGSLKDIKFSGGNTDDNGTYNLSLSDAGSATFTNIPMETEYTITETLTSDQEDAGWEGPADDLEGTIENTTRVDRTVENTYDPGTPPGDPEYGSLKVTKDVLTEGASTTEKFAITVAFSADNLSGIQCSGGTWNDETDTYDLSLADGESATFTNIPMETEYTITEHLTSTQISNGWFRAIGDASGTISDSQQKNIIVKNTYGYNPPPNDSDEYGSLIVTKNVSGTGASTTEKFDITVQFTGSGLSGIKCSGGTLSDTGTYILSLADGESATFTKIPLETDYTVTETLTDDQTNAGWTGPDSSSTGTITDRYREEITVENIFEESGVLGDIDIDDGEDEEESGVLGDIDIYEGDELPDTGGISNTAIIGILGILLISSGLLLNSKIKSRNK